MNPTETFEEMARRAAEAGAGGACAAEADRMAARGTGADGLEAERRAIGARGLRIAARILEQLVPGVARRVPFRPLGLQGALLAGHVALAEARPSKAERIGQAVAAAAPDLPDGLRLLGEAFFAQGRFEEAEVALREALGVDASDSVTRALRAEALWFSGREGEAESEFARVVATGGEGARLAEALWFAARSGALDGPRGGALPLPAEVRP